VEDFTPYQEVPWEKENAQPIIEKEEKEKFDLLNKKKTTVRIEYVSKPPNIDLNVNSFNYNTNPPKPDKIIVWPSYIPGWENNYNPNNPFNPNNNNNNNNSNNI
jgi:hypothetical protein